MKKLIIASLLIGSALYADAQGVVSWNTFAGGMKTNTATSLFNGGNQTGGVSGVTAATANGFYYTLLFSSSSPGTTNPVNNAWTQAQFGGAGAGMLGTNYAGLTGDMQGPKGSLSTTIDNVGVQSYYWLTVGWSASLGSTWSTVYNEVQSGLWAANGFFGVSSISSGSTIAVGSVSPTFNPMTGSGPFSLYSVTAAAVPEPGTLALAALGGASLLLFRRRK